MVPPQFAAAAASWGTIMPAALYRAHPALPTTSEGFGALLRTVIGMPLPICLAPTGSSLHRNAAASYWESIIALQCYQNCYHRLTRANTPASAPLRRFLSLSPWRAPARLRLKSQKSLGNPSQAGAKQFCRAEMCPDKERPAGNTCRISKGLDAVWAYFCPSKPCLPLSTDGSILQYFPPFVNEIFINAPSCFSQPMGYNKIIEAVLIKPVYPPGTALPCLPPLGKGAEGTGDADDPVAVPKISALPYGGHLKF